MGSKVKLDPIERERISVPGAGSYNPLIDFAKLKAPKYSLVGRNQNKLIDLFLTPGPGSYSTTRNTGSSVKKSAPSYGFGSSVRKPLDG